MPLRPKRAVKGVQVVRVLGAALLTLGLAAPAAAQAATGRGLSFWGTWPRSHLSLETSAEIIVLADAPTTVAIDGAFTLAPQPVGPGAPLVVPLPDRLRNASNRTILPSGFHVTSLDAARPISVLLRVPRQAEASDDIARLLPDGELGTSYLVTAWQSSLPGEPSLYAVVATEDDTDVSADVPCAGTRDSVTLDAGEVYQVLCSWTDSPNDVTGAMVDASKPVVVLAGNSDAYVPTDYLSGDFVVEAMLPIPSWGREFLAVPFELGPNAIPSAHDVLRIVASSTSTVTADDGTATTPYLLAGPGSFVDVQLTVPLLLTADFPVSVHQFMTGVEMSDMGDPSMVQLQPTSHWAEAHRFYAPPNYSLGSFLTVAVPNAGAASVELDGAPVGPWIPAPGGQILWTTIPLGTGGGEHVVASDGSRISAIVHGYNADYVLDPGLGRVPGSYAYPAADAEPPCLIFPAAAGPSSSCLGRRIDLADAGSTADGCAELQFRWLKDGVPLAGCDVFTAAADCSTQFTGQATYTLEVQCVESPACVQGASVLVVDQPAPPQTILHDPGPVCPGQSVLLEAEIGFTAYFWTSVPPDPGVTPRSSSLNTLVVTPDVDTRYTLLAADSRGCTSVATADIAVLPDPLPPPVDASLRVIKAGGSGVRLGWVDIPGADVAGYEAVFLECPTRDYRSSCSGRVPDPVTIQAAPRVGPPVPEGQQRTTHFDALLRGGLIFYKVRGLSPCSLTPGPTCNGWPLQVPPCP